MNCLTNAIDRFRWKRLSVVALGPLLVLQIGLLSPTATSAATPSVTNQSNSATSVPEIQIVTGVRLSSTETNGNTHTYEVLVSDRNGNPIDGAELDLGALQADPDIRVPTTALSPSGIRGSYRVSIAFPADGDWMLVVRVHAPTKAVELFTETISGAGGLPSHSAAANSPSRRALRAADPTFNARYNPSLAGTGFASSAQSGDVHDIQSSSITNDTLHNGSAPGLDLSTTVVVLVHSAAAGAWVLAILGLVLANRIKPAHAQGAVLQFVAQRYTQLAGGGLAIVTLTGLISALRASAGLANPKELASTNLGIAYLAVFGLKMVLVAGGILTSWRIGRLMPTKHQFLLRNRLASVGAMANEDPDAIPNVRTIFRLAETNMILAVAIIGCVAVLGQLHHGIS